MIRNVFILLCILLVLGCQDNKTKHTSVAKPQKNQKKTGLTKKNIASISTKKHLAYAMDTIQKVKQIHLKPFLLKYGKKHPETLVLISTKFGEIKIKLFKDTPLHRANFIRMANLGYFDTTYFYRVVQGFVIQAGNSDDKVTARMRRAIGDFLIPKEFHNDHLHHYGAVSMAKFSKQNISKASSPYEFFIVMNKNGAHHLDFEHTVFGEVVKGMDVAEKISKVKTGSGDWPENNILIKVKVLD